MEFCIYFFDRKIICYQLLYTEKRVHTHILHSNIVASTIGRLNKAHSEQKHLDLDEYIYQLNRYGVN